MKKIFALLIIAILTINSLTAQMTVSGVFDSTAVFNAGAGESPAFSFGIEEFANIRFQARLRERGSISGAVNFIAASGDYALPLAGTGIAITDNFIAAIELERLQFRLRGEHIDIDGGLFRLPFGYGQVWGPSDFLNPKNPLKPDARPRAVLGAAITWFPIDELKLLGFFAAPRTVLEREGKGSLVGLSLDRHWDKASLQALYSYETPKQGSELGIHRAGLSLKFDIEVGFVIDVLYAYNHKTIMEGSPFDGLSFSFGADYSFFDGSLILLAEYLYNGKTSATASGYGGSFFNNHYLYTGITWSFNDFANIGIAVISCFDDISFTPLISFNQELFQGATLTIIAQVPLDRDLFHSSGRRGELGPIPPGFNAGRYFSCTARIRLRF